MEMLCDARARAYFLSVFDVESKRARSLSSGTMSSRGNCIISRRDFEENFRRLEIGLRNISRETARSKNFTQFFLTAIRGSFPKQNSPVCAGHLVRKFPFHGHLTCLIISATNGHLLTVCAVLRQIAYNSGAQRMR